MSPSCCKPGRAVPRQEGAKRSQLSSPGVPVRSCSRELGHGPGLCSLCRQHLRQRAAPLKAQAVTCRRGRGGSSCRRPSSSEGSPSCTGPVRLLAAAPPRQARNFIPPSYLCLKLNVTVVPAKPFGTSVSQINFPSLFSVIAPGESAKSVEDRAVPVASSLPLYQRRGGFVVILDPALVTSLIILHWV